jgi:hypothetical protein
VGLGLDFNLSSNVNGIFSSIERDESGTYTSIFTAPSREELSDSFNINITISKKGFHYGSESINIEVIQEPVDLEDDNTLFQYFIVLFMLILIVFIILIIVRFKRKNMNSQE